MASILAIDIGGTKTATAICDIQGQRITKTSHHRTWPSLGAASFHDIAQEWVQEHPGLRLDAVGIGIAGPVLGTFPTQTCSVTNLKWTLESSALSSIFGNVPVFLCNDMEAHGWGLISLEPHHKKSLNAATPLPGCKALIAAGTGLGESLIAWDGYRHIPLAGEGGHAAFSPSDERDDRLLLYLRKKLHGHVSWERVLGGRDGFKNLAEFMLQEAPQDAHRAFEEQVKHEVDWGATIIAKANEGDLFCESVLTYYATLYGREAANLAVKCLPYNGLYIGGGIAPRIMPWIEKYFLPAFQDKGRFGSLLQKMPVYVVHEPDNGLRGAAFGAWHKVQNDTD